MRVFIVSLAVFGGWLAILPGSVETLFVHLAELNADNLEVSYALLLGIGWAVFMVALVFGGQLGDRSASSRRTIIIIGICGLVAGGLWMLLATSALSLMIAWAAIQIPAALVVSSALALALTHVSTKTRRLASGLTGTAAVFAIFFGILVLSLVNPPTIVALAGPALVGSVLALPLLWLNSQGVPDSESAHASNQTNNAGRNRRWALLLVAGFLISCATSITNGFVVVFVSSWMSLGGDQANSYSSLLILAAGFASIISGVIVGLVVPRPTRAVVIYGAAALVVGLSIALMVIMPSESIVWVAGLGFGAGFGAANGLELTLVAHLQPKASNAGKDVALYTASTTLPYVIIPFMAAGILATDVTAGIGLLWWIAAGCAAGSAVVMFANSRSRQLR
jgi:MFS family permease